MSILQISQAANVSYATAWRIINNRPCRSEESVRAVRAAMERLGYTPAGARRGRRARYLEGVRTHNIALLHLRPGSSISTSVLNHVQSQLAEQNLNLIFAQMESPGSLPQAVRADNVDGILGYGEFPTEAVTDALKRIPAVWMMSRKELEGTDPWGDRVRPDNYGIGRLAGEHIVKRGHKRVAYFNLLPDYALHLERGTGFKRTMAKAGVEVEEFTAPGGVRDCDYDTVGKMAGNLVERWITATPRATAIFVPVDRITLQVYRHLVHHGIEIGRDVELVSCDNEIELLSLMHPRPVSVDLNRKMIARLAVERLYWRMKNGVDSPSVEIVVAPSIGQEINGATKELVADESVPG